MYPRTQHLLMVEKLVIDPKPLKTRAGAWYALLKLENLIAQEDGGFKHGPAFTVILRGLAANPGMPIYTARKGCVVMVVGRLSSIWTKSGISTVIESGWVNVILHPGASKHMKFAQSENAPPMNTAIDLGDMAMLMPDNSQDSLDEMVESMGAEYAGKEKVFTENLMSEVLMRRLQNEGIRAIGKTCGLPARKRKSMAPGKEPGLHS